MCHAAWAGLNLKHSYLCSFSGSLTDTKRKAKLDGNTFKLMMNLEESSSTGNVFTFAKNSHHTLPISDN